MLLTAKILKLFKESSEIEYGKLVDCFEGKSVPDFKGVLRKMPYDIYEKILLIPENGAVAVLLRMGIEKPASFDEIKAFLSSWSKTKKLSVYF